MTERKDRLPINIDMEKPNSAIPIYSGRFELRDGDKFFTVEGEIEFRWFPNSGARFQGYIRDDAIDFLRTDRISTSYKLIIDGLSFGDAFITSTQFGDPSSGAFLSGLMSQKAIAGDSSIHVNCVRFSIPNLRDFRGLSIRSVRDKGETFFTGRMLFEDDEYSICIDRKENDSELRKALLEQGGYLILYDAELKVVKGSISHDSLQNVMHCFGTFLSFLNGRRTSALFLTGVFEDEVIWRDFADYYVDDYKSVRSWPERCYSGELNESWKKFKELWKVEENQNVLSTLVHWYVQANGHAGFAEGSIMMAQAALELVYNWWIVEDKQMVLGKDSESLAASNKIRLLLSQVGVDARIPESFTELADFISDASTIKDGPEAIVQIRNAIVHSQKEKRIKLSQIHYKAKSQALNLSLWYIELCLLRILKFDGKYNNRCADVVYASKAEQVMPWAIK